jgi:2'-hydroxyisoflavone reductase
VSASRIAAAADRCCPRQLHAKIALVRVLVLGGTAFVGRAIVEAALEAGAEVTTFNRGRSGDDVSGVRVIRGDRETVGDVVQLARAGSWDVVVDTSGYVPRNTLSVMRLLEPVVASCIFMSTVSVYAGWPRQELTEASPLLECPPDAGPDFGVDVEDGPTRYGYQKSGCEAAVRAAFGPDRSAILRPGVVLGPREYVGRLPWWLRRVAAGGTVIAPGEPERGIQPVDVRDLADFALMCATSGLSGAFNVTAPIGSRTFGDLLAACVEVTQSTATLAWVPDVTLIELGVRQWSELPLWRSHPGVWRVDSTMALSAGLRSRPIFDTVHDTWAWMSREPAGGRHERAAEIGLSAERERLVLTAVSSPE